ncbi:MAG: glycosyltransferase family 4 protein [Thermoproteota archaeon]
MDKKSVAFVYDAVYPWIKGGIERRIYEIGRRLSRRHEVHWFGLRWWNGEEKLDGIILHGVGEGRKLYVGGRRSISEALYFGFKTLIGLRDGFDLIDSQAFPYFSCLSSKLHSLIGRFPLVVTWHELWGNYWFEYLGPAGLVGWIVERAVSKIADIHVTVSEMTRRQLENIGVKSKIIPNGIDFERIKTVKMSDEESDIIFAGRLIREKNVGMLIRAVKILKNTIPSIKCIIIGDGPEKKKLEILSKELGVSSNIVFKGFLENHDEVVSYMKASKVFVLPSAREGFGIVVLEANACGLPVVTVRHARNAARYLVKDGLNGFTCFPSAQEIRVKIVETMNRDMREECIRNAARYDWSNIVELYENLIIKRIG